MATVYIALGANLGDREGNIRRALSLLEERGAVQVVKVSRLSETVPVGGPAGQPEFLNGAAEIETQLQPEELLRELKAAEKAVGRRESERWGPREIDLDILLYGGLVYKSGTLEIPHPMMREREFVIAPLEEIAGDAVEPVSGKTIRTLLEELRWKKNS